MPPKTANEVGLQRISGALLTGSLIIVLVAAAIMITSGATPAFFDLLGGSLAGLKPYLWVFRASTYMWAVAWMSLLLGFVALTRLLTRYGDDEIAPMALAATIVAMVLAMLEATFTVGVTTWAVEEAANTGATPEIYTVLEEGLLDKIQFVYTILGFAAQAGFGAALLKTGLLASSVGWTAVVWGSFGLAVDSFYLGIPGLLFFIPAVIGISLLARSRTEVASSRIPGGKETISG